MLHTLAEGVIEHGLQVIGWSVLKVVTLGRYRGLRLEHALPEGAVGLATIAAISAGAYWLLR